MEGDIDSSYAALSVALLDSAGKRNPIWRPHKEWFDDECRVAKARCIYVLQKLKTGTLKEEDYWVERRSYRRLIKAKKEEFQEKKTIQRINAAEITAWTFFKKSKPKRVTPVELAAWEEHFRKVLNPHDAPPIIILPDDHNDRTLDDEWYNEQFELHVVEDRLKRLKDHKSAGPDQIAYEHLKQAAPVISSTLTSLLNTCLRQGKIPNAWREATLKVLYKDQGSVTDPNNYRGIALLQTSFKLLTSLLADRIIKATEDQLPDEQYGFRRGRSTTQAIEKLLVSITSSWNHLRPLYVVFVDFRKAFPSVDRKILVEKLDKIGIKGRTLELIADILSHNKVRVDDGLRCTQYFNQHLGLYEGDVLSPYAFILFVKDLAEELKSLNNKSLEALLDLLMYADDLSIYSESLQTIQEGMDTLDRWCVKNNMTVNTKKTKVMKFRRGGRLALTDKVTIRDTELEFVNSYKYLGVTMQTKLFGFSLHVKNKKRSALAGITALTHLSKLSLETAMEIFRTKICPMVEYALSTIAPFLNLLQLKELDKIKAAFCKRALSLHTSVSSTLALTLSNQLSYCEDLQLKGLQFRPEVWQRYVEHRQERQWNFVVERFTDGPAFDDDIWKRSHQKDRHIKTRITAHGLHFLICQKRTCYVTAVDEEDCDCICRKCLVTATRYHIMTCSARPPDCSIVNFASTLEKELLTRDRKYQ